jgi:hypothetical protein
MERPAYTPKISFGEAVARDAEHQILRALFDYWQSKRRGAALPRLSDLDPPAEIPRLTATMSVVLIEGTPPRFKYKRMGSAVAANRRNLTVHDATGRYLDEIDFHSSREDVLRGMAEVARLAQPFRELGRYPSGAYTDSWFEWLILPLAEDGRAVDALITGYVNLKGTPAPARR